jgi:hypothetical protein
MTRTEAKGVVEAEGEMEAEEGVEEEEVVEGNLSPSPPHQRAYQL